MTTWVVMRGEGDDSDYRMVVVAVHDSEAGARADAAERNRPAEEAAARRARFYAEASERMGVPLPADFHQVDKTFWDALLSRPEETERYRELNRSLVDVEGVDYSVCGPFAVVPWTVPVPPRATVDGA